MARLLVLTVAPEAMAHAPLMILPVDTVALVQVLPRFSQRFLFTVEAETADTEAALAVLAEKDIQREPVGMTQVRLLMVATEVAALVPMGKKAETAVFSSIIKAQTHSSV